MEALHTELCKNINLLMCQLALLEKTQTNKMINFVQSLLSVFLGCLLLSVPQGDALTP